MGPRTRRFVTAPILVVVLFCAALSVAPASAATKKPTSASALRTLVKQTKALPRTAASVKKRNYLRLAAAHAQRSAKRSPCASVKDLARYRRVLQTIKVKSGKRFRKVAQKIAALQPASMKASRLLLASKKTKKCGGGNAPSSLTSTQTKVLQSDANGMKLHVDMPDVAFAARQGGGQSWTQVSLPNTGAPAAPGEPSIPVASSTFAVPDGATLEVDPGKTKSYTVTGVDLFPAQPDVVDDEPKPNFLGGVYKDAAFTVDKDAYKQKGYQPSDAASGQLLGQAGDLNIGDLLVPAVQYDPLLKKLKVLTSIDVQIKFNGGDHTFSPECTPWAQLTRQLASSLLNGLTIGCKPPILRRCGNEMIVITNPGTLAAANQFANGKRAQGMRVLVAQTGASPGIGSTAAEIQAFIRSQFTALLCIKPSYVTIMGDDDLVPTFTDGPSGIPSDLKYSLKNDSDELPDLAIGRIIGNDQAAIATAVTKILNYENSPPGGAFLTKALIAAQFQDDDNDGQENRTFITFAETVYRGLKARGVTVDRIYGESPGNNPQRFQDGTALPADLLKPAFGWNGTGAQVSAGWNEGRFMVVHRDHGYSDGWGTPSYGTADVNALTNGSLLPVVLSVNCSSGAYDYDETSFAGESLVKANGGSVGVFGDTRDSPSTANTQMSLGFVDGMLPSVLPAEGPATAQRTGFALINGKLRLNGIAPLPNGTTRSEFYLWHYYGDPSMQMWGGGHTPFVIDPATIHAQYAEATPGPTPPPYMVNVTLPPGLNGQLIGLLRNGDPVGKATIAGDAASIPADFDSGKPLPGELQVVVDADGYQPATAPVDGVPPPPPPAKTDTAVSQTCPNTGPNNPSPHTSRVTTQGTIAPVLAGATIKLTYTRPDATTFERTATTNADGAWADTIVPGDQKGQAPNNGAGTWKVQSRFDGDATHNPSPPSAECLIYVFDNS